MAAPLAKEVEEIVLACLSKAPEDRPRDAGALAEALSRTGLAGAWDPARAPVITNDGAAGVAEASTSHPSDDRATRPLKRVSGG
jgi:hypothetical protein